MLADSWQTWPNHEKLRLLERLQARTFQVESRRFADETFSQFLHRVSPSFPWDAPHIVNICAQLDRVTRGEIKRLIIQVPPRHYKSETVTVRYPVHRMMSDPSLRVIVGAYNVSLARMFGRKARRVAVLAGRELSAEQRQQAEWETPQGGAYLCVGVGSGVTGRGAKLMIIDDPVKSREEAERDSNRDRVWDWWVNDVQTRLEPDGAAIVIMTRWHHDDLAGRLIQHEGSDWHVVSMPAIALANDPWGREPGEALMPSRFDINRLRELQSSMGRDFESLYQQDPQPRQGGMFQLQHLGQYVAAAPREGRRVMGWDTAATPGRGDYTAGVLLSVSNGVWYVEHVIRAQVGPDDRRKLQRSTAELLAAQYGISGIRHVLLREGGSGGVDQAQDFIRFMAGFPCAVKNVSRQGNKAQRLEPFAAQIEAGNVRIVRGPWNAAWVNEMLSFTGHEGGVDDQADATYCAFSTLASQVTVVSDESPTDDYRG